MERYTSNQKNTSKSNQLQYILSEIVELYPTLKALERKKDTTKEAIQCHYEQLAEENDAERITLLGMRLHYKRKSDYTWKKEEFNEELEDNGGQYLLAKAKKVDKHVTSFLHVIVQNEDGTEEKHDMSYFALAPEAYVRPYPKGVRKKKKNENQDTNDQPLSEEELYYDQLMKQSIEEVVTAYKLDKMDFEEAKNRYEQLKKALLQAMMSEDLEDVQSEMGKFTILYKAPSYDLTAIIGHRFTKTLAYQVVNNEGTLEVTDLFSKETRPLPLDTPFVLDEHTLLFTEKGLEVDGQRLFMHTENDGSMFASGETEIDSATLLRQLPFSTQDIERLIDDGLLHPKTLDRFRYVASIDDLNVHFEIIEEDTHNARIEMFMRRQSRRAEKLRYMQEQARNILRAL